VRLGVVGVRLVQPAGLRHANAVRVFVAREDVQQRDLLRQGQLPLEALVGRRAPEEEAAGEGQQVQFAGQVGLLERGGQLVERAEAEQVLHAAERRARAEFVPFHPARHGTFLPARGRLAHRQEAEARGVEVVRGLAVDRVEELLEEHLGRGLRCRPARGGEEALPEAAGRPLLTAAEERPADATLVVLGACQRQRHQDHVVFVGQLARRLGQGWGPV
jgi:hypothetical protein